jgi:multidrug transporter EmrE-like cation transporter
MKEILVASGIIGITSLVEAFGLYFVRAGGILNIFKGSLIYGLGVAPLLSWATKYEGIGIVNFIWNILSTLVGFSIGIYMFKEKVRSLQWAGILLSLSGLALILIDPEAK